MQSTTTLTKAPPQPDRASQPRDPISQQRRSQLLNALLLIIGIGVLILTFFSQINSLLQPNLATLIPELGGLLVIAACYGLSRFGFTTFAAIFFFLAINAIIGLYIATREDNTIIIDLRGLSPLLTVPVMASGIIIGPIYSFVFATISVATIFGIAITRISPDLAYFQTPLDAVAQLSVPTSLLFAVAALSWFFERNIRNLLSQLTAQNRVLDAANRELARKAAVEQQLTRRLDTLSQQFSTAFEAQARETNEQVAAVLRASTTIEELNRISESISFAAIQVDRNAQEAFEVVETGTQTVRNGLTSLTVLTAQTQAVSGAMDQLSQQARQIDQITELISEIAEETNLLSLNAKIEAAGAGEYGRRFASVAGEVQRLANRSHDASAQVRMVVEEIRRAVENSLSVSRQGIVEAAQVISGAHSVELTLEEIVRMVETTANLARQITVSLQEQREATVEFVSTMRHISGLSTGVAQGSQELMSSLFRLNEAVTELSAIGKK